MTTDELGNAIVDPASITDSVLTMIWMLFSLFPAAIAVLMIVLIKIYPIKK
jgi:GPH family glycoside/pentoside/hexuronide:cation symporter